MNAEFWRGRSVFLTGHTGFKGGWLALWLSHLGAKVCGYSLDPPSSPNFYSDIGLRRYLHDAVCGDVRDLETLTSTIKSAKPSIVIHMAAQSLVRDSYQNPVETFNVNVIGTVNVLEAARQADTIETIVNVTTDKCYENREWVWAYRENDRLGGHDPYSSSKACAEIAAGAYRTSYLEKSGIKLANARAGNVIGGGDWARDRLIPDFFRAVDAGVPLKIRSPTAVRPWQHVLDPLAGYLILAEKLTLHGSRYAEAWNFGPEASSGRSVSWIADYLCEKIPKARWELESKEMPHEAKTLKLDSSKSNSWLGWSSKWPLDVALDKTIDWYLQRRQSRDMYEVCVGQIGEYSGYSL